ncbi:MAG: MFS transporter [Methanosarcinales archaeon]|nr:MFS transporter [Methanosarcinales archaeon]
MNENPNYKWKAMFVVSIGVFMATLDSSIINISLPTLTKYFLTDITTIQWVILSYLLTITALLLTLGRISDMYGRKPVFILGLLIFTLGSGLCSFSATAGQLIAFRVVQGLGAAMIMANGPAIITHVFPHTERGKALGLIGTVVSIGFMAGPALGGFLIGWIGWQSIFYINIPIGLLGTVYALKTLHPDEVQAEQKFDVLGAVFMFISLTALLLGITQGEELRWGSLEILGLFILFTVFLLLFLIVENRTSQPMVELSLFRNRPFSASNMSGFLSFVAMSGVTLLIPYYLENILGYNITHVGVIYMAIPLVMALVAPVSGWISDKTNSFKLSSAGMGITSLALWLISDLGMGSSFYDIIIRLALVGLGMGLFQSPNNSIVMGAVPKNRLGIAGGMLAMVRNLGMVTGIAIAGVIFTRSSQTLKTAGFTPESAFLGGFHDALMVAALICGIGVLTSLVRGKLKYN